MAKPYPVDGVGDAGIQPRLEIRDLQKNKPIQFSLFVQAFNKIIAMRSGDKNSPDYLNKPNSWWQIGAIHGLPFEQWSGDPNGQQNPNPGSAYGGYCYHAAVLFPTWHRVVLSLAEQAIVKQAIEIATHLEATNPAAKNEQWVQAAKELRFPFWDWTKTETAREGIPQIFQETQVWIARPGDRNGLFVENPLNHYRYAAAPGTVKGVEYMGSWKRTFRWVDNGDNPTKEQYDLALKGLSVGTTFYIGDWLVETKPVHWLRGKVAALFQYPLTLQDPSYGPNMWGYFSNTAAGSGENKIYPPVDTPLATIEEPHNKVHLDIGGNGSMSINEYAGFDPIFYLHHCNIDRLYAFWEYVYPNYWIEDGWKDKDGQIKSFKNNGEGNFEQDPGAPIHHVTPLIPFRNKYSEYWTSDDTRGLLTTSPVPKYYTYPAIKDPRNGVEVKVDVPYDTRDKLRREQYRQALLNEWNPDLHHALRDVQSLSADLPHQHRHLLLQTHESGTSRLRNFVVQAELPEFAFPGSYRLELYVRPKNPQQAEVNVINNTSVLARGDPERCAACQDRRAAKTYIRGYMHLDPRVVLYLVSQLDPTQLAQVTDVDKLGIVVKESLGTRVVRPDGTVLAVSDAAHVPASGGEKLEEAKAPELTLHSHLIAFDHNVYTGDVPAALRLEEHTNHGGFGDKSAWKVL